MAPDGSLNGATSINDYHKALAALKLSGRPVEGAVLYQYFRNRFLSPSGGRKEGGSPYVEPVRAYCQTWTLMAAVLNGQFDDIPRVARYLASYQDPATGGFFANDAERDTRGHQDLMTTGVALVALLWAGYAEPALRAAEWIRRLLAAQPDLRRGLYLVTDRKGSLVTDFAPAEAWSFFVDASGGSKQQRLFECGIGAAALAAAYDLTQDPSDLKLGRAFLSAAHHCDRVFEQLNCCKIGWGAAWLLLRGGTSKDRNDLHAVYGALSRGQHPDGWWGSSLNVYENNRTTGEPSLPITGEFVALAAWMETALALDAHVNRT
jgi:hypothetical protein